MIRALLVLSLLPGCASAALPRIGDYLDIDYIKTLQKTHSPLQAAADDARAHLPQLVSIQAQGAARRFAANYDWHSGRLLFVLQRDGTIHRELAWGADPAMALRIAAPDTFCLAAPGAAEHCYQYVRDAAAYITRATLVGHYVDRQGAAYWFGNNGQAHFPGYDCSYGLMLEQVADRYDFFAVGTEGRFMAFKRAGALLSLYAMGPSLHDSYGTPDFRQPLAVLREAAAPRVIASN